MSNPLLLNEQFPKYDQIKAEHFVPATEAVIEEAQKIINEIKNVEGTRTHTNTILASNKLSELMDEVITPMSQLYSLMGTPEIMQAFAVVQDKLTVFYNETSMDPEYYKAFKEFNETEEAKNLTGEKKRNLDEVMKGFRLAGADLAENEKEELKKINLELSQISMKYQNNLVNSKFDMIIEKIEDLKDFPQDVINAALAKYRQTTGNSDEKWMFNLDFPSLIPFMKYSVNEEQKRTLWLKNVTKATEGDLDNRPLMVKILKLRQKKAELLGFKTYADYSLEKKMAESPEVVMNFLTDISDKLVPISDQEYNDLKDYIGKETGTRPDEVMPWNNSYWSNKLQEDKYSYNSNEVREYFEVNNSLEGLFTICKSIFGLTFKKEEGIPVWHKDVTVYSIWDEINELRSYVYIDLYPRSGLKRAGAWMSGLRSGKNDENGKVIPVVGVHCNFTEPVGDMPALLTYDELQTLFHEFGHALHGALSKTELSSTSGTNVAWDTVELPSSFMENFVRNEKSLKLLTKHYKTGEPMPESLMKKLLDSNEFQKAMFVKRQITFGMFDLTLHHIEAPKGTDVDSHAVFEQTHKRFNVGPYRNESHFEAGFAHIFAGGYAAGYYSYMWANILEADAFSYFEENDDILSREKGRLFMENILEKGNSEDMNILFEKFRGRPVSNKPLLKRFGLKV
ncbi:MAG: M3 family metallopeptidase [Candidatus Delongbacteria bacterium]|nr:M3 family metallopeptidase [Candidatus Delongbacteria bacterium]MBN2836373.1 M3 family metallopeptidase [Candidatus Delongbacteria bacterium]